LEHGHKDAIWHIYIITEIKSAQQDYTTMLCLGFKPHSSKIALVALLSLVAASGPVLANGPKKSTKEPVSNKWVAPKQSLTNQNLASAPVLVLREPGQKTKFNVYQFDVSKSWGLKFEFSQPQTQPMTKTDIDAGAYFRLNPSVSFGGSLGLGEKTNPLAPKPLQAQEDQNAPRVRLETQFKF
jgi:hypothetical protein